VTWAVGSTTRSEGRDLIGQKTTPFLKCDYFQSKRITEDEKRYGWERHGKGGFCKNCTVPVSGWLGRQMEREEMLGNHDRIACHPQPVQMSITSAQTSTSFALSSAPAGKPVHTLWLFAFEVWARSGCMSSDGFVASSPAIGPLWTGLQFFTC